MRQQTIQHYLNDFDFHKLFIEALGWDFSQSSRQVITLQQQAYTLQTIAQKRGMIIYVCEPDAKGNIPPQPHRESIEKEVARTAHEHIIIYIDACKEHQCWQWVRRTPERSLAHREVPFHKGLSNELLLQKLQQLSFDLDEEAHLGIAEVAARARQAFDVDRITRRFYERFQHEHAAFMQFIQGITTQVDREWYTSLMLNRLMFIYFIQKKGFLDNDVSYLPNKLQMIQQQRGYDTFLSFYRHFLLRLFHEGLNQQKQQRASDLDALLGDVPYLNGGLFDVHELERNNAHISIPDEAFERLFTFFESHQWQLDERPLHDDREINPDVIGYIFEKYINQKQMGAYYTREDITNYMSKNAIIPHIFTTVQQNCQPTTWPGATLWNILCMHPDRYIPETMYSPDYLPEETEREYIQRSNRYTALKTKLTTGGISSIDDFITYNLDLCRFAQDTIANIEDSSFLRTFYESIESITILDPTCGSGAFLFAALNILAPLYAACLTRMRFLVEQHSHPHPIETQVAARGPLKDDLQIKSSDTDRAVFQNILQQVDMHPNPTYFIYKAIAINNLYGVDIMKEAAEICKLRLFLKLIAQIQLVSEIEPLPDIDFNIRSGNALVGFARYEDVQKAVLGSKQGKLDFDNTMSSIEQEAKAVEDESTYFRALQTQLEPSPSDVKSRKQQRRLLLRNLQNQLDAYLAGEYGIDHYHISNENDYKSSMKQWRESHQPFHWFLEFYGIMQRGGFDVILGNPPYVEYSKVRQSYKVQGYETESCGNLYAAVIERALALSRPAQSYLGLIVPLSICGGERFVQLRSTLLHNTSTRWLANFEIFPCRLFDGAFQRLSILIAKHASVPSSTTHVTKIQRWYTNERPHLIPLITYTSAGHLVKPDAFPKLASSLQETILQKVHAKSQGYTLASVLYPQRTEHFVYYQEATNYWMKAVCCIPFYRKNGVIMEPPHGRFLYFRERQIAHTTMALMNSSLFYIWFATYSDGFHLSHALVKNFPAGRNLYSLKELPLLSLQLEEDIQCHAKLSTRNTKLDTSKKKEGHSIDLVEYRMSCSKPLLDQIDVVLANYYSFTDEELDFIINYDIKYRMGKGEG